LDNPNADYSSVQVGTLPTPSPQSQGDKKQPTMTTSAPVPYFSGLAKAKSSIVGLFNQIYKKQRLLKTDY